MAGHRLGALEGGGTSPPSNASLPGPPPLTYSFLINKAWPHERGCMLLIRMWSRAVSYVYCITCEAAAPG